MGIRDEGRAMTADRNGLGFLGFIFAGVTTAVMIMATTVVVGHVEGKFSLEQFAVIASFGGVNQNTH
jgi:hypothetical protein